MSLDEFRQQVGTWLAENCPPSMRKPAPDDEVVWGGKRATFKNPDSKRWLEAMASKGWTAPTWPTEYGGGGLSGEENRVLASEMAKIGARAALHSFGLWMLGPVLLEYGNEAQRQRFLPDIIHGRTRWCQGYTSPALVRTWPACKLEPKTAATTF